MDRPESVRRDEPALSAAGLSALPTSVDVPRYDRSRLTAGIVHIGVGGFHRAHEAVYVDRLLRRGSADEWGICGVGLLPHDRRMHDVLGEQDGLYTVVERAPDGSSRLSVVGSIIRHLHAPDDPEGVIETLAAPSTRIVSLTITEGGYNLRGGTGDFDTDAPEVVADLGSRVPRTVFGVVIEALARRRDRGVRPFTVLSCDNLEGNGEVARRAFGTYAHLRDPVLGEWVHENVSFPSSMVDRITPVTTDADRDQVAERLGVRDGWPVVCEPFSQWVLQDDFVDGRPPWEEAGVEMVDDVRPYELMKLRLLNASHQVMGYLGRLAGFEYVHEVCADPHFARLVDGYLSREATPTLEPVGVDLGAYRTTLMERFTNSAIADTLARQCVDSSERMPKFLFPVIREQLRRGGEIERAALAVAAWARCAEEVDERGGPMPLQDQRASELTAAARRQRSEPLAFLQVQPAAADLLADRRFTEAYVSALRSLHDGGALTTVRRFDDG
ncbi:mannitol dehydrogenase family protein [Aeromicrobium sp.]|uniref:mannitol dehydrogenase family protein n=1 Tax=Aeromicrobium sp. TaxID=1871063 RepID=UPI0028A5E702|nr:mannitol dehydrogenase family protein [Aeromicrobium sp.]